MHTWPSNTAKPKRTRGNKMSAITYYSATENMGDDVTESDAEQYRAWAKAEIEAEYPEAEVTVSKSQSLRSVDADDDLDGVEDFCKSLWDNCPWSWVS